MNDFLPRFPSLSKAVRAGGFLFLSGLLALDARGQVVEGGVQIQTKAVMERIAAALAELGATMASAVRATIWLADLGDFAAFNEAYAKHFADGFPARSLVQAALYNGAAAEIEVQAWLG